MLTVSQVARAAGVSARAVRLYEARGMLPTAARTPAGYRVFDEADVDTVRFIRRSRALGLSLAGAAEILAVRRAGTVPCQRTGELLDQRIAEIEHTLRELRELRTTLLTARRAGQPALAPGNAAAGICPLIEYSTD